MRMFVIALDSTNTKKENGNQTKYCIQRDVKIFLCQTKILSARHHILEFWLQFDTYLRLNVDSIVAEQCLNSYYIMTKIPNQLIKL